MVAFSRGPASLQPWIPLAPDLGPNSVQKEGGGHRLGSF